MNATAPSLVLLIPAYNEARRIDPVLSDYASYFQEHYPGKFQIVVVSNGSRDDTVDVVQRVAERFGNIDLLEFRNPIGKGGALIEGLKRAPASELIGYVDADGATPPHAFLALAEACRGVDCVIGSRWMKGARIHHAQPFKRRFASRVFHALVQLLFRLNLLDTQCGAKVMRRDAVAAIHPKLRITDMAFDINLLYSLQQAGFRIIERPTEWTDRLGSKVRLFKSSLSMLLSLVRLRLVYSPFYRWMGPFRPIERWLYRKLGAPPPLHGWRGQSGGGGSGNE